jgi:hypothetical protein
MHTNTGRASGKCHARSASPSRTFTHPRQLFPIRDPQVIIAPAAKGGGPRRILIRAIDASPAGTFLRDFANANQFDKADGVFSRAGEAEGWR